MRVLCTTKRGVAGRRWASSAGIRAPYTEAWPTTTAVHYALQPYGALLTPGPKQAPCFTFSVATPQRGCPSVRQTIHRLLLFSLLVPHSKISMRALIINIFTDMPSVLARITVNDRIFIFFILFFFLFTLLLNPKRKTRPTALKFRTKKRSTLLECGPSKRLLLNKVAQWRLISYGS